MEKKKKYFSETNEKNKWLDLQKLYLQGKVKEDMTSERISALEKLFDSQIETAKRPNENKIDQEALIIAPLVFMTKKW